VPERASTRLAVALSGRCKQFAQAQEQLLTDSIGRSVGVFRGLNLLRVIIFTSGPIVGLLIGIRTAVFMRTWNTVHQLSVRLHDASLGLEQEVAALRAAGLAKGGSLDNAVVIGADNKILNEEGLRYDDEFVRHKVLDAVGDLYLAGHPILGRFKGRCSGHAMNNLLLRTLFSDPTAYRIEDLCEALVVPAAQSQAAPARFASASA